MPIINGTYQNFSLNLTNGYNGTAAASHFVTAVPRLTPWAVSLAIIGIYAVMFYALREDESRWKFVTITFVPMFISIMFALIGWTTAPIVALTVSVWLITSLITVATTG
jgi:hypothetical protein